MSVECAIEKRGRWEKKKKWDEDHEKEENEPSAFLLDLSRVSGHEECLRSTDLFTKRSFDKNVVEILKNMFEEYYIPTRNPCSSYIYGYFKGSKVD